MIEDEELLPLPNEQVTKKRNRGKPTRANAVQPTAGYPLPTPRSVETDNGSAVKREEAPLGWQVASIFMRAAVALAIPLLAFALLVTLLDPKYRNGNQASATTVTAAMISGDYASSESGADANYKDKTITVTGTVVTTGKDIQGNYYVVLSPDVQCTGVTARIGDKLKVTGECEGHMGNVLLDHCTSVPM